VCELARTDAVWDDPTRSPNLLEGAPHLRLEENRDSDEQGWDGVLNEPAENWQIEEVAHQRPAENETRKATHQHNGSGVLDHHQQAVDQRRHNQNVRQAPHVESRNLGREKAQQRVHTYDRRQPAREGANGTDSGWFGCWRWTLRAAIWSTAGVMSSAERSAMLTRSVPSTRPPSRAGPGGVQTEYIGAPGVGTR